MRVPPMLRRHPKEPVSSGVSGVARVDARTKNLTKRLQHGQIAVIEHLDLSEGEVGDRVRAYAEAFDR